MDTENLWRPKSPCGPGCLPSGGQPPAWFVLVVVWRMLATTLTLALMVATLPLLVLFPHGLTSRLIRWWSVALLRALGVRLRLRGSVPGPGTLLVVNHISWLDILAVLAVVPARPVAKQEVRHWPLVGSIAMLVGTHFIDRSRPRSLPLLVGELAGTLRGGAVVLAFPEGTTWCGRAVGAFRPALFQAAIDAGARVVPARLGYQQVLAPGRSTSTCVAAFVGDDSLVSSVLRVLWTRRLGLTLRILPQISSDSRMSRSDLATVARAMIDRAAGRSMNIRTYRIVRFTVC